MVARYILTEGWSGFRRTKLAAAGSIATIAIALLLLGFFSIVAMNTSRIVDGIKEKVEIEAFLLEPVSRQRIDEVRERILAIDGVERVEFVSKEEAAKIFQKEFGEDVNTVLEFNPLPPSFRIHLAEEYRTAERASKTHAAVLQIPGIDNSVYRKDLLEFIERQTSTLSTVGLAVGAFIAVSAIFFVANTIRLTIAARRRAIQTMKLVGASRWFVRAPFLIDGMLQGAIGGSIAAGIVFYVARFAASLVSAELAEFVRVDDVFYLGIVGLGIVLGVFGSAISVRRHIGESVV